MKRVIIGVISIILAFIVIKSIGIIMGLLFKAAMVVFIAVAIYLSIRWMFRREE